MDTSAQTRVASTPSPSLAKNRKTAKQKHISWSDFQKRYLSREDGFKYEWVNETVIKSKHMDYTQFFIVFNLRNFFEQRRASGKVNGILMLEGDMFFHGNHRRPDIAYLSDEQIAHTAYGENQTPSFVIEVISTKDQMNLVHQKMENYREAGVQVVWHIFPLIKQVHVYTGATLQDMKVCKGEDVCRALPGLPGFEISANDIFRKPPKPE